MSNRVTIGVTVASAFVIGSAVGFQLLKSIKSKRTQCRMQNYKHLYLIVITSYVYKYIIYMIKGQWS